MIEMTLDKLIVLGFLCMIIVLAIGLTAYAFWIRIRQSTYTERRFNFVALWSCTSVMGLIVTAINADYFLSVLYGVPPLKDFLEQLGVTLAPPDTTTKIILAFLAIVYLIVVSRWAENWNGVVTEKGQLFREREGRLPFFLISGAEETLRILKGQKPYPSYTEQPPPGSQLPEPLPRQPFPEQVRDLVASHMPHIALDNKSWDSESSAWRGQDTSVDEPVLIVCAVEDTEVDIDRLTRLGKNVAANNKLRVICVLQRIIAPETFEDRLKKIASTVQVVTLDKLILKALPFNRYRYGIDKEFATDVLPGSDDPLAAVFVPAKICEVTHVGKGKPLRISEKRIVLDDYVAKWLNDKTRSQLAILGTYGQGKSSAVLALTHKLLHNPDYAQSCGGRIPILIRLTGLSPKTLTPEKLLDLWGAHLGLGGRALLALHRMGRTLVIFDAFDEMAGVSDRADRLDHFGSLWQFATEGSKVLFTGRPNFFLDDEDLKNSLGIASGIETGGPQCRAFRLAPFDAEQIKVSLRNLPLKKKNDLLSAVEESYALLELAKRPSLLFQLSQLWRRGRIDLSQSVRSATVIRQFISYSLERQVQKQTTEVQTKKDRRFIPLTQNELYYFTCGCAVIALCGGRNNTLTEQILRPHMAELLTVVESRGFPLSPGEVGSLGMPLKERLADCPDPVGACIQAVRTHGVIEDDPTSFGTYKFSHKSFAEVLAAEAVTATALSVDTLAASVGTRLNILELTSQDSIIHFSLEIAKDIEDHTRASSVLDMLGNLSGHRSKFMLVLAYFFLILQSTHEFVGDQLLQLLIGKKKAQKKPALIYGQAIVSKKASYSARLVLAMILTSGAIIGLSYLLRSFNEVPFLEGLIKPFILIMVAPFFAIIYSIFISLAASHVNITSLNVALYCFAVAREIGRTSLITNMLLERLIDLRNPRIKA